MVWFKLADVPLMVNVNVPCFPTAVLTVNLELPPPGMDDGLKEAEAPLGNPLTARLTVDTNPLMPDIVTV